MYPGYDNFPQQQKEELVKQAQLSDENIMYQIPETTTDQKSDRNLKDSFIDFFGF